MGLGTTAHADSSNILISPQLQQEGSHKTTKLAYHPTLFTYG